MSVVPSETICASPASDWSSSRRWPSLVSQSRPDAPESSGEPAAPASDPSALEPSRLFVNWIRAVTPSTGAAESASWTACESGSGGGVGSAAAECRHRDDGRNGTKGRNRPDQDRETTRLKDDGTSSCLQTPSTLAALLVVLQREGSVRGWRSGGGQRDQEAAAVSVRLDHDVAGSGARQPSREREAETGPDRAGLVSPRRAANSGLEDRLALG